jgi:spore germination protein KB
MRKEVITSKQAISMLILFITNGTLIFPSGVEAKKDIWIAIIAAMLLGLLFSLMYSKLLSLFPGEDLYDILINLFGRFLGKLFCVIYIWFSFNIAVFIIEDFTSFITTVTLPEMNKFIIVLFPTALCAYGLKNGIEVLGRFSELIVSTLIILVLLAYLLLTPDMDIKNLMPVFEKGISPILSGTFSLFTIPFGEIIVFTALFSSIESKDDIKKSYLWGILIGGSLVLLAKVSDILTLGIERFSQYYFPNYAAVSRIQIGEFIQRIEIISGLTFTIAGLMKLCICMLSAAKGTAKVLNIKSYRFIVVPLCLLLFDASFIFNKNIIELTNWTGTLWRYYSLPFEVILPVLIFCYALIKVKMKKKPKPSRRTAKIKKG